VRRNQSGLYSTTEESCRGSGGRPHEVEVLEVAVGVVGPGRAYARAVEAFSLTPFSLI
jgi:hypothetical protein